MRVDVSKRAETDLDRIFDYTFDEWGGQQALDYTAAIRLQIGDLGRSPDRLRRADVGGKRLFRLNVGSHAIWARVGGDVIRVVRVLHQRMDPAAHL